MLSASLINTTFAQLGSLSGSRLRARSLPFNLNASSSHLWRDEAIISSIFATNLIVYMGWQISGKDSSFRRFMKDNFTNSSSNGYRYHTLLTSCFSHDQFWHLALNMNAFLSLAPFTISSIGAPRFLLLYFGGGIVSSFCQVLWPHIIPEHWPARKKYRKGFPSLGASGALNALAAWTCFSFPSAPTRFFCIIPLPLAWSSVLSAALDGLGLYYGNCFFGNAAHLGGTAFGTLMFGIFHLIG